SWSKVVFGSRKIPLWKARGNSGNCGGIRGWLVDGAAKIVCGVNRNGQLPAEPERYGQPVWDLDLVISLSPVVGNGVVGLWRECSTTGVVKTLMNLFGQAQ